MTKLKEVAEQAGVSPATVSRVLNGVPGVTDDLRDRVLQTAADMGYRPNRRASNLRRQKTGTIGVVVSDIENPHFSQMVRTIEASAYARGYRVLLCNTDESAEKQQAYLQVLAEERVEGVILVPFDAADAEIGRLIDLGIPVVALDRAVDDPRADAVISDNAGGARRAVELLLDAGHERIGFVGGSHIQTGVERLAGYEAAMRARGLSSRAVAGVFRIAGSQAATEELLDAPGEPITALIVANNLMTIGALRALADRRLRLPDDIAFVALDDSYWSEFVDPPLTCLAQPIQQMATASVDLLFERIRSSDESPARRVVHTFELRVRESCGTGYRRRGEPRTESRR